MDTIDLVVDFATLGEYGLEALEGPETACAGERCELDGRRAAWEVTATPRRGSQCEPQRVSVHAGRTRG